MKDVQHQFENLSLDDSRLDIYRDLRNKNLIHQSGLFVAEGWRVVERLLRSQYMVHSVLLSEKRQRKLAAKMPGDLNVYVIPEQEASRLIGFNFHEGVLACGYRLPSPSLESITEGDSKNRRIILCCPRMTAPDNLGSLIRLGASFGIQGILLGPGSVDPYIRRVIRVSMGTRFELPIAMVPDLYDQLEEIQKQKQGVIIAAEKTDASVSLVKFINANSLTKSSDHSKYEVIDDRPLFVLLGNEADGLDQKWLDLADQCFHIPIQDCVDSLNVTNAAAIFLYELTRVK